MKVAGFIANRVAFNRSAGNAGGQKSFSRFIIRLATVATAISVAVMIITISLANGFQQTVSQKVFSFLGHIRINEKQPDKAIISEETPILKNDSLVAAIQENPKVNSIHPFATKYAILKTKEDLEGVLVKGFDKTYDFNHIRQFIIAGGPIIFNDSTYSRQIMISDYTARQLDLHVNDRVLIYFIRPGHNNAATGMPNIRPDKLTITGIFKTDIEDYDKTFAIGDLKLIQQLNGWNADEIGGYEIFLKDYHKIDDVANDIYALNSFPITWNTVSVKQISPNIFDWLGMQDITRNVLIGFMIIVALINLITCLIVLLLERVRMIGVLKAIGARDRTVQEIFLRHALFITVTGIFFGVCFGLGFLWLQEATGFIRLKAEAYYMSTAAVKIVWWQVGFICAGTFFICLLVLMIPTLLVRKIKPVTAIQFR